MTYNNVSSTAPGHVYHPMNTPPSTEPPNSVQVLQGDTPSTGNFTFGPVHDYDKEMRYDTHIIAL